MSTPVAQSKLERTNEELVEELRRRGKANVLNDATSTLFEASSLGDVPTDEIIRTLQNRWEAIYGKDNRQDLFEITDREIVRQADAVAAFFEESSVIDNGDGTSTLRTVSYGEQNGLCEDERFYKQPIGAFCSGFLMAPQVIATAGHCVADSDITQIRVVFGFRMKSATEAVTRLPNSEIYRVSSVIAQKLTNGAADWALLKLDRPVVNHEPVTIRKQGKVENKAKLHLIGYPAGLPIKVAGDAEVLLNQKPTHFAASLDAFHGNSGSPVFNSSTNEVEGILVRGEVDFVSNGSCNVANVCTTACKGEDCTRTTEFSEHLSRLL
ncbi:peptidase S1 and S6 chymotrypsin/Hap [Paenibacillus curdlanolyticus YK9]|uniref:Peptidase S1 and S6 chymotrypsin/Hap n=1 Tax=Paenibacillus curdlanolyticus YK9 TaxID=717606 RepID=E0I9G0_9BACL|nr:serine protease [Paenibacillus curdlanolyticus]EFM11044.1 peptidase S1 and S6 chymotrypsin/Hap [Paenibacillus curdlanolyticus YK9]